mgnify:CR=1 FL=1
MIQEDSVYKSLVKRFHFYGGKVPKHVVQPEVSSSLPAFLPGLTLKYAHYRYDFTCFFDFQYRFYDSFIDSSCIVNGRPFSGKTICAELLIDSRCYISREFMVPKDSKVIYLSDFISEKIRNRFRNSMVLVVDSLSVDYNVLYDSPVIITTKRIFDNILKRSILFDRKDWLNDIYVVVFDDFIFDTLSKSIVGRLSGLSKVFYLILPIGKASNELVDFIKSNSRNESVESIDIDSEWPRISDSWKGNKVRSDYIDYINNGGIYLDTFLAKSCFRNRISLFCKDPVNPVSIAKAFGRSKYLSIDSKYYDIAIKILNGDYHHDDRDEELDFLFDVYSGIDIRTSYLVSNDSLDSRGEITNLGKISVISSVYPDDLKAWISNFDLIIRENRIDDLSISWAFCSIPSFHFPSELSFECPNLDSRYSMAVWSLWKFFTVPFKDLKKLPYDVRPFVRKAKSMVDSFCTAMTLVDRSVMAWRKDYLWEAIKVMVNIGKGYEYSKIIALDPSSLINCRSLFYNGFDSYEKIAKSEDLVKTREGRIAYQNAYNKACKYAFMDKFPIKYRHDLNSVIEEMLL